MGSREARRVREEGMGEGGESVKRRSREAKGGGKGWGVGRGGDISLGDAEEQFCVLQVSKDDLHITASPMRLPPLPHLPNALPPIALHFTALRIPLAFTSHALAPHALASSVALVAPPLLSLRKQKFAFSFSPLAFLEVRRDSNSQGGETRGFKGCPPISSAVDSVAKPVGWVRQSVR